MSPRRQFRIDVIILLSLAVCTILLFLLARATAFKNVLLVVCSIATFWMTVLMFIAIAGELSITGHLYHSWHRARVMRTGRLVMKREEKNQCPRCGYELEGNVSGTCPECGRAIY